MNLTIADIDSIVLDKGAHDDPTDGMCVMEVVSLLDPGSPWTDSPSCVSPVIAAFLRSWNDALPDAERQQLKRWIVRVMGTNTGVDDDDTRAWIACDWLVRTQTPAWLRLAGLTELADLLAGMPELRPDTVPTIKPVLEAARKDANAARAAVGAAVGDAAWAAARAAAWDAAWAAARDAAWAAARDAVGDAAWDAARDAAWDALAPTVTELQQSAHDLIGRMVAVGR